MKLTYWNLTRKEGICCRLIYAGKTNGAAPTAPPIIPQNDILKPAMLNDLKKNPKDTIAVQCTTGCRNMNKKYEFANSTSSAKSKFPNVPTATNVEPSVGWSGLNDGALGI